MDPCARMHGRGRRRHSCCMLSHDRDARRCRVLTDLSLPTHSCCGLPGMPFTSIEFNTIPRRCTQLNVHEQLSGLDDLQLQAARPDLNVYD
jgi:hypothetical protein